jgi:hypothetical protein
VAQFPALHKQQDVIFYEGGKAQHQALNRLATTAMMGQPDDVTFFCNLSKTEEHWEKTGKHL